VLGAEMKVDEAAVPIEWYLFVSFCFAKNLLDFVCKEQVKWYSLTQEKYGNCNELYCCQF